MCRGTGSGRHALCGRGARRARGDRDAEQPAVGGGRTVAGDQVLGWVAGWPVLLRPRPEWSPARGCPVRAKSALVPASRMRVRTLPGTAGERALRCWGTRRWRPSGRGRPRHSRTHSRPRAGQAGTHSAGRRESVRAKTRERQWGSGVPEIPSKARLIWRRLLVWRLRLLDSQSRCAPVSPAAPNARNHDCPGWSRPTQAERRRCGTAVTVAH